MDRHDTLCRHSWSPEVESCQLQWFFALSLWNISIVSMFSITYIKVCSEVSTTAHVEKKGVWILLWHQRELHRILSWFWRPECWNVILIIENCKWSRSVWHPFHFLVISISLKLLVCIAYLQYLCKMSHNMFTLHVHYLIFISAGWRGKWWKPVTLVLQNSNSKRHCRLMVRIK